MMLVDHPCVRYSHISGGRALVVATDIEMPEPGKPCRDERLLSLLEYLEMVKHEHEGEFDSIEIRGKSRFPRHDGLIRQPRIPSLEERRAMKRRKVA